MGAVLFAWSLVAVTLGGASSVEALLPPSGPRNPWSQLVVSGASSPTGEQYVSLTANGFVGGSLSFFDFWFLPLNAPTVGVISAPNGHGVIAVAADGGVFIANEFELSSGVVVQIGDARFLGSMGGQRLNAPIVGIEATTSGNGYWLVAVDGGVFAFGDARFFGSMGGQRLNAPIVGIAATTSGNGYWLVARDGGVFAFGDARFFGSLGAAQVRDVVGIAPTPSAQGYWIATATGRIDEYGDAVAFGDYTTPITNPVVAIVANPVGIGYRLQAAADTSVAFGDAPAS